MYQYNEASFITAPLGLAAMFWVLLPCSIRARRTSLTPT